MADRLLYTKGMRAALRLLAEDPRVSGGNVPAAVLAEHRDGCDATIGALESVRPSEALAEESPND